LIACLVCFAFFWKQNIEHFNDENVIWTYWYDKENIPQIVQLCIDTWRTHNPEYRIEILNNFDVKILCGIDIDIEFVKYATHDNKFARYADIARILVVKQFGGIWMDSTNICTKPLTWATDTLAKQNTELVGFYGPHTTIPEFPILENWFFAAKKNSLFLQDWWAEVVFMYFAFETECDYINYIKRDLNIDIQGLDGSLPYLIMHLCANVIIQRNPHRYNLVLTDAALGPFKYLVDNNWITHDAVLSLVESKTTCPLIKMRGVERDFVVENHLESSIQANLAPLHISY
jgi:hypothetical protein